MHDIELIQEKIERREKQEEIQWRTEQQAVRMTNLAEDICDALKRGATVKAAELVLSIEDTEFDKVVAFTQLLMAARGGREA